jgi:hypothetical protein
MPKTADSLDICFDGPVLTGRKSVEEQQRGEAVVPGHATREAYKNFEDYDPVLRSHTGPSE